MTKILTAELDISGIPVKVTVKVTPSRVILTARTGEHEAYYEDKTEEGVFRQFMGRWDGSTTRTLRKYAGLKVAIIAKFLI